MKNKNFLIGILAITLVFAMTVIGCDLFPKGKSGKIAETADNQRGNVGSSQDADSGNQNVKKHTLNQTTAEQSRCPQDNY